MKHDRLGRTLLKRYSSSLLKKWDQAPAATGPLLEEAAKLYREVLHTVRNPFPRPEFQVKQKKMLEVAQTAAEIGSAEGQVQLARCVLWGFGRKSSPKEALEMLEPLAKAGFPPALTLAGNIYRDGLEKEVILPEHKALAYMVGDKGLSFTYIDNHGEMVMDPSTMKSSKDLREESLGKLKEDPNKDLVEEAYREGTDTWPKRFRIATVHYEAAIENEYVQAYIEYGHLHCRSKEYQKAAECYREAAQRGSPEGHFYLGDLYYNGKGVELDLEQALKHISMAASLGNADACFFLGYYELNSSKETQANGMKALREAVKMEHNGAIFYLALMYRNGEPPIEKNLKKFKFLAERAGQLGHPDALYCLGDMYYKGECGEQIDYPKALKYFMEAGRYRHALALYAAGTMFYRGLGTKRHGGYAMELYADAAGLGLPQAMRTIAMMYKDGDFSVKNEKVARDWLEEADRVEADPNRNKMGSTWLSTT